MTTQLRIGGKTLKETSAPQTAMRFSLTLIDLIETARRSGALDQKAEKMRLWLAENTEDDRWPQRSQAYWRVVSARNHAVAAMCDHGTDLGRLYRQMTDESIAAMSEAIGAAITPEMASELSAIARAQTAANAFDVIDQWARDHNDGRNHPPLNAEPCPF